MALNAGWNDELLKIEFENLKELDFDLNLTGFSADEIEKTLNEIGSEETEEDKIERQKKNLKKEWQVVNCQMMMKNIKNF